MYSGTPTENHFPSSTQLAPNMCGLPAKHLRTKESIQQAIRNLEQNQIAFVNEINRLKEELEKATIIKSITKSSLPLTKIESDKQQTSNTSRPNPFSESAGKSKKRK